MKTEIPMPEEVETFFWYDGPILYSAQILGQLRLVTLIKFGDNESIYMVSSPSEAQMRDMAENRVPLRDVSDTGPFYRMTIEDFTMTTCLEEVDGWPEGMLPDPGVLLSLDTTPAQSS